MKMIALQLDLARQKESVNFVKSYVDFAKKSGYNTIFLYLETCVRTADTPFFDPDETYSFDEMKEIVGYIEGQGLTAVPAFENFYHVEKLLCYDEVAEFAEFPDEKTQGRGWTSPAYKRGAVGCVSNPAFNAFFDKYISDVCSLFHGEYVHMGLDEIFEFGECPRCRERLKNGETKKEMFLKQVLHNYELAKKLGKKMMMWDDFFEYYDITKDIPRDIILGHWTYGFIGSETKGHWTGRVRKDWLSVYDELGFEYFFCAWGRETSSAYNTETLTAYALKHKPMGALMTEWELSDGFYAGAYPIISYAAKLWRGEIRNEDDAVEAYAKVVGDKDAARLIYRTPVVNDCLYNTAAGKIAEDDNLAKLITRRYTEEYADKLRGFVAAAKGEAKNVLLDIYDNVYARLQVMKLHALGDEIFDGYEVGRTDFSSVYKQLDEITNANEEINANAEKLWGVYRDGIKSVKGKLQSTVTARATAARNVKKQIEENIGCGVLFIDMVTPDAFSSPKIRIRVGYEGDAEETLAYEGAIKPGAVTFDLGGCHTYRLAIENRPVDYVTISACGEGSLKTSSLRLLTEGEKLGVIKVEKLGGKVVNENALLTPDVTYCEYGYDNGVEHLDDVSLCRKESGVKIYFGRR